MSAVTPEDGRWLDAAARYAGPYLGSTGGRPLAAALVVTPDGIVAGRAIASPDVSAELAAITAAGPRARGATLVATLEPMAEPLIEAGIARVVVGTRHPDPARAGKANTRLRDAGVDVALAEHDPSRRLLEAFAMRVTRRRPFVTIVLPISKDGMLGARDGTPLALGEAARRWIEAQCQRADARLRHEGDLLELTINARAASRWHVRDRNGRPDIPAAISDLVARDVSAVVALPDAPLAESLIGAGLGDRLFLVATEAELGRSGVPATALGTIEGRLRAARLTQVQTAPLGTDSLRTYEPER